MKPFELLMIAFILWLLGSGIAVNAFYFATWMMED